LKEDKIMKTIELNGVTLFLYNTTTIACAEYELAGGRQGEMRRLAQAWVDGDEMAGNIWSDLYKEEYGLRPRYTREEVRRMLRG
jgi:hypothetical protein